MNLEINQSTPQIEVNPRYRYNFMDVTVRKDEVYQFICSGRWVDLCIPTDEGGFKGRFMFGQRKKISPEDNWLALMGSINMEGHFLIGKNERVTMPKDGSLYCFANDWESKLHNNWGRIKITITRLS